LRAQGRRTLNRLLEAALLVFDERGYHAARVDDIVRAAKASHGTFYLYFSSKEDLFRALFTDVTAEMISVSASLPSIRPTRAGYDALREWLERYYDVYRHYHPVLRAFTETEAHELGLGRTGTESLVAFTNTLTKRMSEVDPSPVSDSATAALAMVSMMDRMTFYTVTQVVPVDDQVMLDTMASILHVGLFGGSRRNRK